ncbi:hypothetical protein N1030_12485 [Desulfovibrio mangrovi]|uniref:hypothetical protein n=1 Tax=Desulfovibrio mangrovi TaxID=2976983 RepID=UPI0022468876|nr:hypothetical protein [Desulfovibrio mangrovi]UZP66424.1 hypothetical protein N1030_12485 [Desulfovibrio mangrovi]
MNQKQMPRPLHIQYRNDSRRLIPASLVVALAILMISLAGCAVRSPTTAGDALKAPSQGYTPLDPLPLNASGGYLEASNEKKLKLFPDETMRLAVGEIQSDGSISFGMAHIGNANSSYKVILDYAKSDTKPLHFIVTPASNQSPMKLEYYSIDNKELPTLTHGQYMTTLPAYVGVALRITADIKVLKGKVDLANMLSLGIAAQAGNITGTLTIQTLGISGEPVTSALPLPNEVSKASIQSAIQAMGTIKAKLYDKNTHIQPRFIGYYNYLGGGKDTATQVITAIQQNCTSGPLTVTLPD